MTAQDDGKPGPLVARSDKGAIQIIAAGGWAAAFKDGAWHDGILFSHLALAEFAPVTDRADACRIYDEARSALGLPPSQR
jgi:hypothetical protein